MARARLRDRHQNNLMKKLQILKDQQGVKEELADAEQPSTSRVKDEPAEQSEESRTTREATDDENDDEDR